MTNNIQAQAPVKKVKAPAKRRKAASLDRRKARAGWVFVLPFVIGFILIYIPIVIDSIIYSFSTLTTKAGQAMQIDFVGWENYNNALFGAASKAGGTGDTFVQILIKGLQNMIFDIPMILIFSLFMAVLLNQKMAGRAAFRAILFVPVILSTGIMESINSMTASMQTNMESAEGITDGSGSSTASELVSSIDVQQWFDQMIIGPELADYVSQAINNIFNIVNHSGVQILIFLSGLQSISPAIYESVQIDGASAWETFWKITFPMISPMILVNAVYTIIDSFTMESNVVMKFISNVYSSPQGSIVASSAMSWMYFLIVIGIIGIVAAVFSAYVFYQRRD